MHTAQFVIRSFTDWVVSCLVFNRTVRRFWGAVSG